MSDIVKLEGWLARSAGGIPCKCGGYADRDYEMTLEEIKPRSCGRDTTSYQCCARAFVCRVCGARMLGVAEPPEME